MRVTGPHFTSPHGTQYYLVGQQEYRGIKHNVYRAIEPRQSMPMPQPTRWARPAAIVSGVALATVAGSNLAPIPWAIAMSALLSLFMISVRRWGK